MQPALTPPTVPVSAFKAPSAGGRGDQGRGLRVHSPLVWKQLLYFSVSFLFLLIFIRPAAA